MSKERSGTLVTASVEAGSATAALEAQRRYTEKLRKNGFNFGLVVAEAFVNGIRDLGYKSTATALDELIDNSIQAGATRVDLFFGYDGKSDKKPGKIAVLDNGHGMDPDMIRAAVIWGGTHREGDRSGLGRYGYGLPSATVSQGKRFTVYSKAPEGRWHSVYLDLEEVAAGVFTRGNEIVVPEAIPTELPTWVREYVKSQIGRDDLDHGTLVVIEKLDKLSWTTTRGLSTNLLQHLGIVYRNYLRQVKIVVDGTMVEPLDPLFITPGMRFYDLTPVLAEPLPPMEIPVKVRSTDEEAVVRVRFSYMPPLFQTVDGAVGATNARWPIMKEHRGIVVCRAGRQIDVVDAKCPWFTFQTYDCNWGAEIDFPPVLDEEFSITTSKQQVVLTERMWEILKQAGVKAAISDMRKRYRRERAMLKAQDASGEGGKRTSETVMEMSRKFKPGKRPSSPEREKQGVQNLENEVKERSSATGVPQEQVRHALEQEIAERPYKVEYETLPGAPFFRVKQLGGQRVLLINRGHRFFTDVYSGPETTPHLRAALEILLFVIGDAELDAEGDRRVFYETERAHWSTMLNVALDQFDRLHSIEDETAAEEAAADEEEEGLVAAS